MESRQLPSPQGIGGLELGGVEPVPPLPQTIVGTNGNPDEDERGEQVWLLGGQRERGVPTHAETPDVDRGVELLEVLGDRFDQDLARVLARRRQRRAAMTGQVGHVHAPAFTKRTCLFRPVVAPGADPAVQQDQVRTAVGTLDVDMHAPPTLPP
jgi:hypothetical protein